MQIIKSLSFFAALVAVMALATPDGRAQIIYEDQAVGHDSPIPEVQKRHTIGREYEGLKPGLGREEVYFAFSPCLKVGWIKRQAMAADQWRVEVQKMAEQCRIAPLSASESDVMVNYLATYYGPDKRLSVETRDELDVP